MFLRYIVESLFESIPLTFSDFLFFRKRST